MPNLSSLFTPPDRGLAGIGLHILDYTSRLQAQANLRFG
jgi:hypothetical protein